MVLLSVLVGMAVLALLLGGLLLKAGLGVRRADVFAERLAAQAGAEAALWRAVAALARDRPAEMRPDGRPWRWEWHGTETTVRAEDEGGKVDLNAAPAEAIAAALSVGGCAADACRQGAAAIVAWRQAQRFVALDQLTQVPDLRPALAEAARPALTVYSHRPQPQLSAALPRLRAALGGPEALAPARTGTYAIAVTARTARDGRYSLWAVIRTAPLAILAWKASG